MKTYTTLLADAESTRALPKDEDFCTDVQYLNRKKLEYKTLFGNENIVFIKAGAGGTLRGRNNKYLEMARRVHERIGATVICANNPDTAHENYDEQKIRWVAAKGKFKAFKLFFWGTSDGAYQNLSLAKRFSETVKWIGVNSSFISFADFEKKLQNLLGVKKVLVYGTADDEYDTVVSAPPATEDKNRQTFFIEGADHRFSKMLPKLIQTIDFVGNNELAKDDI